MRERERGIEGGRVRGREGEGERVRGRERERKGGRGRGRESRRDGKMEGEIEIFPKSFHTK